MIKSLRAATRWGGTTKQARQHKIALYLKRRARLLSFVLKLNGTVKTTTHVNINSHLQPNRIDSLSKRKAKNSPVSSVLQMDQRGMCPVVPSRKREPLQTLDWTVFSFWMWAGTQWSNETVRQWKISKVWRVKSLQENLSFQHIQKFWTQPRETFVTVFAGALTGGFSCFKITFWGHSGGDTFKVHFSQS